MNTADVLLIAADAAKAQRARDALEHGSEEWYAADDVLAWQRDNLSGALTALPEEERDVLVAMYDSLRRWAY